MKHILKLVILLFILSGCEPQIEQEIITCADNEEMIDGVCVIKEITCTEPEILRNNECIIIPDPIITLEGDMELTIQAGFTYEEPGATAIYDGLEIDVTVTGDVLIDTLGTYTLTYNAVSNDGKTAESVTRTVHVVDTTPPVIDFGEWDTIVHEISVPFDMEQVIVKDNYDSFEQIELHTSGTVDINTIGDYQIDYYAIDSHGNQSATITRTVSIVMPAELSFTERFLKDHTALYNPYKMQNNYTYAVMEWVHQALVIEDGEYVPKLYFFLHNEVEGQLILKQIDFVCPSRTESHVLDDNIVDYAFEMPIDCMSGTYMTIITYAHDDYDLGKTWTAAMNIPLDKRDVEEILKKVLRQGNLL